jgi:hypothetical protein
MTTRAVVDASETKGEDASRHGSYYDDDDDDNIDGRGGGDDGTLGGSYSVFSGAVSLDASRFRASSGGVDVGAGAGAVADGGWGGAEEGGLAAAPMGGWSTLSRPSGAAEGAVHSGAMVVTGGGAITTTSSTKLVAVRKEEGGDFTVEGAVVGKVGTETESIVRQAIDDEIDSILSELMAVVRRQTHQQQDGQTAPTSATAAATAASSSFSSSSSAAAASSSSARDTRNAMRRILSRVIHGWAGDRRTLEASLRDLERSLAAAHRERVKRGRRRNVSRRRLGDDDGDGSGDGGDGGDGGGSGGDGEGDYGSESGSDITDSDDPTPVGTAMRVKETAELKSRCLSLERERREADTAAKEATAANVVMEKQLRMLSDALRSAVDDKDDAVARLRDGLAESAAAAAMAAAVAVASSEAIEVKQKEEKGKRKGGKKGGKTAGGKAGGVKKGKDKEKETEKGKVTGKGRAVASSEARVSVPAAAMPDITDDGAILDVLIGGAEDAEARRRRLDGSLSGGEGEDNGGGGDFSDEAGYGGRGGRGGRGDRGGGSVGAEFLGIAAAGTEEAPSDLVESLRERNAELEEAVLAMDSDNTRSLDVMRYVFPLVMPCTRVCVRLMPCMRVVYTGSLLIR